MMLALDDQQLNKLYDAYGSLIGIIGLALAGIILLLAFYVAWRRYQIRRQQLEKRRLQREKAGDPEDLWQKGGERLAQEMTPPPEDDEDLDEDDEEDEDDWWQTGG